MCITHKQYSIDNIIYLGYVVRYDYNTGINGNWNQMLKLSVDAPWPVNDIYVFVDPLFFDIKDPGFWYISEHNGLSNMRNIITDMASDRSYTIVENRFELLKFNAK